MKRFWSCILTLCMCMAMMAVPVSAAETPDELTSTTFADAYDYVYGEEIFVAEEGSTDEYMTGEVTRGEYAIWLARWAGGEHEGYENAECALTDMAAHKGTELYAAVAWGVKEGVINGYKDGQYKIDKTVSREEICAMFARYYKANPEKMADLVDTGNITVFADYDQFSDYAKNEGAIEFCVRYGLIQGYADGTFGFGKNTTRQQMAAILYRSSEPAQAINTTKFLLEVVSGDGFVSARVNEAYVMQITVADEKLSPDSVTLNAEMRNVASLGVGDQVRKHSVTVETGLEGDPSLTTWLNNCFEFEGATANVDVCGKKCVYNVLPVEIDADGNAVITFVPADTQATREAWHELTAHVETSTQAADDSYIVITNGSELQLGAEVLTFENSVDELKIDKINDIDTLEATIRDAVKLDAAADDAVVGKLAAGTTLAVGSSVATLKDDVTVTIDGVATDSVATVLSTIRDAESTYAMAEALVKCVNSVIGAIDEAETVNIVVDICE